MWPQFLHNPPEHAVGGFTIGERLSDSRQPDAPTGFGVGHGSEDVRLIKLPHQTSPGTIGSDHKAVTLWASGWVIEEIRYHAERESIDDDV